MGQAVAAGMNPMDLRKGIKLATDHVVTVLSDISKPISTKEEVAQVGTISANRCRRMMCVLVFSFFIVKKTFNLYFFLQKSMYGKFLVGGPRWRALHPVQTGRRRAFG